MTLINLSPHKRETNVCASLDDSKLHTQTSVGGIQFHRSAVAVEKLVNLVVVPRISRISTDHHESASRGL